MNTTILNSTYGHLSVNGAEEQEEVQENESISDGNGADDFHVDETSSKIESSYGYDSLI